MNGRSQAPALAPDEFQQRMVEKLCRELGPQICAFLEQPDIIEIMLNPDGTLWIDRLGGDMEQVGPMSAMQAEALMGTVASTLRTAISRENPVLECELPLDGSRFEAVIPPIVSAPSFTIRRSDPASAIRKSGAGHRCDPVANLYQCDGRYAGRSKPDDAGHAAFVLEPRRLDGHLFERP